MAKSAPNGAMSAGNYATMLNGRGNPPRYTHLPHGEAWAKIDAEEAAQKQAIDDARIEHEVQRRLAVLAESVPEATAAPVTAPVPTAPSVPVPVQEAKAPCNKFGKGEMAKVLTFIAQVELGEIAQASDSGIVLTVNGVKVCICKA